MLKLAETASMQYLCSDTLEEGAKTKLIEAFRLKNSDQDDEEVAKDYIRAKLEGRLRTVVVNLSNFHSVEDCIEITEIVERFTSRIPLAKKRAEAALVLQALFE